MSFPNFFQGLGGLPNNSQSNIQDQSVLQETATTQPQQAALSPEETKLYKPLIDQLSFVKLQQTNLIQSGSFQQIVALAYYILPKELTSILTSLQNAVHDPNFRGNLFLLKDIYSEDELIPSNESVHSKIQRGMVFSIDDQNTVLRLYVSFQYYLFNFLLADTVKQGNSFINNETNELDNAETEYNKFYLSLKLSLVYIKYAFVNYTRINEQLDYFNHVYNNGDDEGNNKGNMKHYGYLVNELRMKIQGEITTDIDLGDYSAFSYSAGEHAHCIADDLERVQLEKLKQIVSITMGVKIRSLVNVLDVKKLYTWLQIILIILARNIDRNEVVKHADNLNRLIAQEVDRKFYQNGPHTRGQNRTRLSPYIDANTTRSQDLYSPQGNIQTTPITVFPTSIPAVQQTSTPLLYQMLDKYIPDTRSGRIFALILPAIITFIIIMQVLSVPKFRPSTVVTAAFMQLLQTTQPDYLQELKMDSALNGIANLNITSSNGTLTITSTDTVAIQKLSKIFAKREKGGSPAVASRITNLVGKVIGAVSDKQIYVTVNSNSLVFSTN